jgi:cytochrome oxidase Cu insertion factor (SCO1/SenC/PrrC family)
MSRRKTKRKHNAVEIVGLVAIGIFVVGIVWLAFFTQPQTPQNPNQTTAYTLAPDFTLTDVDGNTFRLSDQHGKVVVLEFMRTTCSACVSEGPTLADLRAKFGGDVVMVSLSVDPVGDTDSVLRNYRNQNMMGWTAIRDTAQVYQKYSVDATPSIFIIDKNGEIRYQHVGVTSSSVLITEVGSLA